MFHTLAPNKLSWKLKWEAVIVLLNAHIIFSTGKKKRKTISSFYIKFYKHAPPTKQRYVTKIIIPRNYFCLKTKKTFCLYKGNKSFWRIGQLRKWYISKFNMLQQIWCFLNHTEKIFGNKFFLVFDKIFTRKTKWIEKKNQLFLLAFKILQTISGVQNDEKFSVQPRRKFLFF